MATEIVVLDTGLAIDWLRGSDPGRAFVRTLLAERRGRLTAMSVFELRVGMDFLRRRIEIDRLLVSGVLALDVSAALLAGQIHLGLAREGKAIGFQDTLIAGICRRFDLPLATRNVRHFERVPGLRLVAV